MNTWKTILATLVIFGAGVATGVLIAKRTQVELLPQQAGVVQSSLPPVLQPRVVTHVTNRVNNASTAGLRKDFLKSLDCELALTEGQRVKIEKILADGQECTKQILDKVAPQVHSEWKCVKENIRAELSDEQKTRFDDFMKHSRKDERKQDETKALPAQDEPSLIDDLRGLPSGNK